MTPTESTASNAKPCRRGRNRVLIARHSTVRTPNAWPCDVTVEDLSQSGFSFTSRTPIPLGTAVNVGLDGSGRACAEVAWHRGEHHGCRFHPPLSPAQLDAAFSRPVDAPIIRLMPTTTPVTAIVKASAFRKGLSLPVRFVVMTGGGMLGWVVLAIWLHGLPAF